MKKNSQESFSERISKLRSVSQKKRELRGFWQIAYKLLTISYSLFIIGTALSSALPSSQIRGIFICFITVMAFIRYRGSKISPLHRPSVVDFFLIGLAIVAFGNFTLTYESQMAWRSGAPIFSDVYFGIIAIGLVFEACRRVMSYMLPLLALLALSYAYFGYIFSGIFSHPGFSVSVIVADVYASTNGIFGIIAYAFSTYVVIFVLMGAFFEKVGAEGLFMDWPIALSSGLRGGPGKAVVFSSTLFGMISGSATANTVATGAFTIPLMKKTGYRPEVAGAIEPAVDVGGMFMPPVMGTAAFIMAELMEVPYAELVKTALVPALIYFFSTLVMIHFEALKTGIGNLPKEERIPAAPIFYRNFYYILPVLILFYLILSGRSPSQGAFYAILVTVVICLIKNTINKEPQRTLFQVFDALSKGAEQSLTIGSSAGPVGIIVGMALLTGIAFKFSALVLSFTFGLKWVALLLVLVLTFVLGMGMTVTSDYIMLAIMAVPGLISMGIHPIAAHFVCFWFSQSSNITPPVCLSVFAGSAIAGTHPYKTAIPAMRFSAYMYIMPFMFIYTPLLMPNGFNFNVVLTWITGFLSTIPFAAGMTGYLFGQLRIWQRIALILSTSMFVFPGLILGGIGLFLLFLVGIVQYVRGRDQKLVTSN